MQYSSSDLSGWASGMIDCGGYSGVSVSSVVCWLENSLGDLNIKLSKEYSLVSGVVSPEMSINDMAVYTQMYDCFFLQKAARQASAYALTDSAWSRIDGDEQGYIARSTPSEIAKVYRGLATDCKTCVEDMIFQYNQSLALPRQVLTYPIYCGGFDNFLPPTFLSRNAIANNFWDE
jgi:hypothetical protein